VYEFLSVSSRKWERGKTALCTSTNMPLDGRSRVIILLETHGLVCEAHGARARRYLICERGYGYLGLYVKHFPTGNQEDWETGFHRISEKKL
jgi:predicted transcriptional regulator